MNTVRNLSALIAALLLAVFFSTAAGAASRELSATQNKAFDKMTAAAGRTLETKLNKQYGDWLALQQQDRNRDAEIKALQQTNDEALKMMRQQIMRIDAEQNERLKKQVDDAKTRYKPLLEQYASVNRQMAALKPLQSKTLNTMLRLQADSLKIPVQLAKQEIKAKENALKTAKADTSAKQKKVRDILKEIEPIEEKIKIEKSAASEAKKLLEVDWKAFTPLIKQGDADGSTKSLAGLLSGLNRIVGHKNNQYKLEKNISAIIEKARKQIPAA